LARPRAADLDRPVTSELKRAVKYYFANLPKDVGVANAERAMVGNMVSKIAASPRRMFGWPAMPPGTKESSEWASRS